MNTYSGPAYDGSAQQWSGFSVTGDECISFSNTFLTPSTNMGKCVKYSSSELLQVTDSTIVIKLEIRAALGRLRLLRTAGWRSKTYRLRGRRKQCARLLLFQANRNHLCFHTDCVWRWTLCTSTEAGAQTVLY